MDVKGGVGKHGACPTPAHARTVRRPAGSPIPSLVGGLKQLVDGLAGHIAVDEDFGQALGNIGGARHVERVPRQGERSRTMGIEQQPGRAPAELIAGALHKETAWGEAGTYRLPGLFHLIHVILAQHIKRAHQLRPVAGQLKTAQLEAHAIARRQHPVRVDLQPAHVYLRIRSSQPPCPLHGGRMRGPVAHIQRQRGIYMPQQRGNLRVRVHPPIAAPQPVVVGGAAGNNAKRPTRSCASAQIMCVVGHKFRFCRT